MKNAKDVKIRVWCEGEIIDDAVDTIIMALCQYGFQQVDQSSPYPCRAPNESESRVYLQFLPPYKRSKSQESEESNGLVCTFF